jgi:hypothetical protein
MASGRDVEELPAERRIEVDTSPSTGGCSGSLRCMLMPPDPAVTVLEIAGPQMRST